jgi:hypothetical protein
VCGVKTRLLNVPEKCPKGVSFCRKLEKDVHELRALMLWALVSESEHNIECDEKDIAAKMKYKERIQKKIAEYRDKV